MRSLLLPIVAASLGAAQQVNQTYVTGLINGLNGAGLTSLANALTSLSSDPTAQALLAQLPNGTRTVFAPSNDALSGASGGSVTSDLIAYHILSGNFTANNLATDPNHSIGRTFLNDSSLVQLEGNQNQVLALERLSNGSIWVVNQQPPVIVSQTTGYENLVVHVIPGVLQIPTSFSSFAGNLTGLQSIVNSAGVVPTIEAAHGITIFAPNNAAIQNAQSQLSGANSSTIATVLGNHIINGTSVYSSQLGSGTHTSASGENFSFNTNSSGTFVTSGGSTAQIVQTDALLKNGVVHVINGVLLNTQSNPSAASSAYSAATSSAGTAGGSPTQTGPIGSSTGKNSAPASIGMNPWSAVAVAIGAAAGAFFTL